MKVASITDWGRPVARLERPRESDGRALAALVRAGLVTPARKRLPRSYFQRPAPPAPPGVSLLRALLDEREENR